MPQTCCLRVIANAQRQRGKSHFSVSPFSSYEAGNVMIGVAYADYLKKMGAHIRDVLWWVPLGGRLDFRYTPVERVRAAE
jgi:hypothetical protein